MGRGWWVGFCSLVKANWGIGMMAMPYYLHKAGLMCGLLFFVFTMSLTFLSIHRLLRVGDELRRRGCNTSTYSGIIGYLLGPKAEALSLLCIFIACVGSNVACKPSHSSLSRPLPCFLWTRNDNKRASGSQTSNLSVTTCLWRWGARDGYGSSGSLCRSPASVFSMISQYLVLWASWAWPSPSGLEE